jgi:hypothetical protein
MHFGSLKCFSSIIENFKKFSRFFAACLEIYLSFPNTEESVSSTKEMIDFLSPLLEELMLGLLSNFLLLLAREELSLNLEISILSFLPLMLIVERARCELY